MQPHSSLHRLTLSLQTHVLPTALIHTFISTYQQRLASSFLSDTNTGFEPGGTTRPNHDAPPTMAANMTSEAQNSDERLAPKVRKRKAYEASSAGKARHARQHHIASQKCLAESIATKSVQVTVPNSYTLLPKSYSGASGSQSFSLKDQIDLLCDNLTFRHALLKTFRAIPYT